jgi:hypothetical protein
MKFKWNLCLLPLPIIELLFGSLFPSCQSAPDFRVYHQA